MSALAPNWFVTQYENRAMAIFQQRGNRLKGMTVSRGQLNADKVRFFLAGTAVAQERTGAQQRLIPSGADRKYFETSLRDFFVYDTCDTYDLERMSVDEREAIYEAGALALARKADQVIYGVMAASHTAADSFAGATLDFSAGAFNAAQAMLLIAALQADKVDWDGNAYCGLPSLQWGQLMANKQFAESTYVGQSNLPYMNPTNARSWQGVNWFLNVEQTAKDYYPVPSSNKQDLFIWHQQALGWWNNTDISLQQPQWIGVEQHWDIISQLKAACAVVQQGTGIKRFTTSSNSSIAFT